MVEFCLGMYGIPQAGRLEHEQLVKKIIKIYKSPAKTRPDYGGTRLGQYLSDL